MEKYIGTARNVRELQELLSKVCSSATNTLSTNQWPEPLVEIWYDAEIDDVLFYVSSTLPNETPGHLAMSLHLGEGDGRYNIIEVSKEEFERETEDEYEPIGFGFEDEY